MFVCAFNESYEFLDVTESRFHWGDNVLDYDFNSRKKSKREMKQFTRQFFAHKTICEL